MASILLREIRVLEIDWPVIVVTGQGDANLAVQAFRAGASEFIEKPYDEDVLLNAVANAIEETDGAVIGATKPEIEQRLAMLSVEKRRVFDGLMNLQSMASIAQDLRTSRATEVHRVNLMPRCRRRVVPIWFAWPCSGWRNRLPNNSRTPQLSYLKVTIVPLWHL